MPDTDIASESVSINRWRTRLAVLAAGALLAACGGGGDSGSTSESTVPASATDSSTQQSGSDASSADTPVAPTSDGESIAVVVVNGVTYTSTGGMCNAFDENFMYGGMGSGSDGSSAHVYVEYDRPYEAYRVAVVVGGTSEIDYQVDQPAWTAWSVVGAVVTLNYVDGTVTGQGEAQDVSQVALAVDQTTPIVVQQASCG